ncbi:MAG: cell division protein SepF [Galactobacter sp.]|uniref:cell division protein SepF n=1 Tax=Galactobacter sp. TaxID=2676125 RepID=UPI0025C27060|nr:cell division protein SepF [Galactobacter sp.]
MPGALRKTMIYLGLAEGEEAQDAVAPEPAPRARTQVVVEPQTAEPEVSHAPRAVEKADEASEPAPEQATEFRAPVTPIKRAVAASEEDTQLRQITTVHPRSYSDAKIIGESFRDGIPVIMNVTDMGEAEAKRLVDFSAGLIFALRGNIERVTNKVFLLSPAGVEVLGEDLAGHEDDALFNQS